MSKAESNIETFEQFKALLLAHPNGLTKSEIAAKMGVHRGTPAKFIDKYGDILKVIEITPNRFTIDRDLYEFQVSLNQHESMAIHIATRLLTTSTDKHNPFAASALRKLSESIGVLAPQVSRHMLTSANVMDAGYRFRDPNFIEVLKTLTKAWSLGQKIRLTHEMRDGSIYDYTFSPYFIEPYAIGRSLHVIGLREPPRKIRTFKVERIRTAELLQGKENRYDIPDSFDPTEHLKSAWGIWYSESKPEEVVLHFASGEIAKRVQETKWHPNEKTRLVEDGVLEWRAPVAEWREMVPWIRSWGKDVTVLAPNDLIELMKLHVHRLQHNYQLKSNNHSMSQILKLWGKTSNVDDVYHPAVYHMLDVGHVAQQLLSSQSNRRWRNVLARAFDVDPYSLIEWLPWLIALHDIGKLSVFFQAMNPTQKSRLEKEGFKFGKYTHEYKLHHTLVGRLALDDWATEHFPKNRKWKNTFLDMVSGHHGIYQKPETTDHQKWEVLEEDDMWPQLRTSGIELLKTHLLINLPPNWPQPPNLSAAIMALNGFTILCDWLGSDESYFEPKPTMGISDYIRHSRTQAHHRVKGAGFFEAVRSQAPHSFKDLFGWEPRPLQAAIDQIPTEILSQPSLTIIESLTGEGKTEAALTLARRIANETGSDEMYIALPTTATSNAMFRRFQEHIRDRLQLDTQANLIHGQAFLVEDDLRIEPFNNEPGEKSPALDWFAPKKRSLLAPFGVGTIDQAELSALNVKHNALRLIGLAGKVVILDEVHAYDTYMATIIERMLEWLSALGTSVILLSATLPLSRRRQMVKAYTGQEIDAAHQNREYPYLLTTSRTGSHEDNPPANQKCRQIKLATLNFGEDDALAKAEWLLEKIKNGGTICWITNIVRRSQDLFEALLASASADVDLELLHSQFPLNDRQAIETSILDKYGKDEQKPRPQKGIVIGTQVLEQSLDLDFDLMVSDLAPIDLLLQRVGRVHRHPQRSNRSPLHPTPHFWINAPIDEQGELLFGADKFYTKYILAKSWEAIQLKLEKDQQFDLPTDYRPLVEHVYSEEEPVEGSPLRPFWDKRNQHEIHYRDEATLRLTRQPNPRKAFWKNGDSHFEEEEGTSWMNAQTRFIEQETITIIPLKRVDHQTVATLDDQLTLDPSQGCKRSTQLELLQRSAKISNRNAVKTIKEEPMPKLFSESGLLKSCYPLFLSPVSGSWSAEELEVEIIFNQKLGIRFPKKN